MKQTKGRQTCDGVEVRRVQVMLDAATIESAKTLGAGNLSAGLREAVRVAQRDMLTPDDASPLDPLPPDAEKVHAEIDAEVRHRNAMWAPIQAIIDEARKALDEADPMGMQQSV